MRSHCRINLFVSVPSDQITPQPGNQLRRIAHADREYTYTHATHRRHTRACAPSFSFTQGFIPLLDVIQGVLNCVEIWCREVLPFSCSFWILRLGPLLVVKVGPRRAPKQAVGRGFTSVEAFDSDRAGGQLENHACRRLIAVDFRTTQTPFKARSRTCSTRPVPQSDSAFFCGATVNA